MWVLNSYFFVLYSRNLKRQAYVHPVHCTFATLSSGETKYAEKCLSFPNNREILSLGCLASASIGVTSHHKPFAKYWPNTESMIYLHTEFCVDWPEVNLTTRPCAGPRESQPFSLEWAKYPTGKPNNLQVYFSPFTLNSCNIQESWDTARIKEVWFF